MKSSLLDLRLVAICAALAAWLIADTLAPHLASHGRHAQLAWTMGVALPGVTLAIFSMSRIRLGRWWIVVAAVAAVVVLGADDGVVRSGATLTKLVCASAVGFSLAPAIRSRVELVVIAVVVAASDISSVADGPSRMILTHHHSVFSALTLQLHTLGTTSVSQLGMTDVLFFAGFLDSVTRLGLRRRATWLAMTGSLAVTAVLADLTRDLMPALPLLAVSMLIVNLDRLVSGLWTPSLRGRLMRLRPVKLCGRAPIS
jgi:hypothetical protein